MKVEILTGNWAAAYGAKLARVNFVSAYPITPQTSVIEKLAEFIDSGELKAKMVRVESEHSAMAAVIGAAAVGARAFTATSAQGLFYMYEMVWWAAGARLPIVMGIVTRALAPPWSIWTDHADFLALRDSGWILLFARNAQEILDTVIQAYKIAENDNIMLPVAVGWDAFIASHTAEPVNVPEQDLVDQYLPSKKTFSHMLDVDNPFSLGNLAFPDSYMEYRWLIDNAMNAARRVIIEADKEFEEIFGRSYGGLLEKYRCEDADVIIVMMGASSGDGMDAVDSLREKGYRVGLCRIRAVRPFPVKEIREIGRRVDAVLVIDRAVSFGIGGILGCEVKAALYSSKRPLVFNFIAGLGGRDLNAEFIESLTRRVYDVLDGKAEIKEVEWVGVNPEVVEL
ncbi:MAG: pyruvate ferredoxin oxidoreductase [Thermoprotei archaeon]|nr:MAG: pyruvate ferredoxin oxidoreductase [Thermoprotei archaeon]